MNVLSALFCISIALFSSTTFALPLFYTFEGEVEMVTDPLNRVAASDPVTYQFLIDVDDYITETIHAPETEPFAENEYIDRVSTDAQLLSNSLFKFPAATDFSVEIEKAVYITEYGTSIFKIEVKGSAFYILSLWNTGESIETPFSFTIGDNFSFNEHSEKDNLLRDARGSVTLISITTTRPSSDIPEPSSIILSIFGVVSAGGFSCKKRRSVNKAHC